MKSGFFSNPIIKGAYPDPSVCRVGDTYYMVTSSFCYFPGLPVFKSKDLVHWEQIANGISRPSQLDYRNCDSSEGLWAATIRYDNGVFYIITTLAVNGRNDKYNFIITATDPAGEWSNAVVIDNAQGIDPSLYFDNDGKMWYCSNAVPQELKYPNHKIIYLQELNRQTFQFVGDRYIIFDGNTDKTEYTEGPHIYYINGYYYLLMACGGTQTNHCVNFAKSKTINGEYTPCPRNPIVTNRHLRLMNFTGISVIGHGDLIETQNGEWYMVVLGIRPYYKKVEDYSICEPRKWIRTPDRNTDAQFNLGREVFLVPMAWDYDEWPIIDNENGIVNPLERKPNLPEYIPPFKSRIDNFESDKLALTWCMRRAVALSETFYSLTQRKGYLRLFANKPKAESYEPPSMLVRRQQHYTFVASVVMEFCPIETGDEAGMIATQNEKFSYLIVKHKLNCENYISVYKIINGERHEIKTVKCPSHRVYLHIEGQEYCYNFYYGESEDEKTPLALNQDCSLLSTLVADGYVGTYIGMYAHSNSLNSYADFDWFNYEVCD